MTFDPNQPYKNIDGININLTADEIAADTAQNAIYLAARVDASPPIPDLATQLAAALISANVITPDSINAATLTTINATLTAAGQPAISMIAPPVLTPRIS